MRYMRRTLQPPTDTADKSLVRHPSREMASVAIMAVIFLGGCGSRESVSGKSALSNPGTGVSLTVMAMTDQSNAKFEDQALHKFVAERGLHVRYLPYLGSTNECLGMYRQLFQERSSQPDICEIDIIWPAILADDLVDLTPYLGDDIKAFPPELIQSFTIGGRLVALPTYLDTGLLYYRSDLLQKYGFRKPPATWDELGSMAKVIQRGERRSGKRDFWGFVWQGEAGEGLTCDALEWQSSEGGGHIIESDGTIRVSNPRAIHALERAVSWIGTISPPGVVSYGEDDSLNVWQSGNAAFMRGWLYGYGSMRDPSCPVHDRFGAALLPGGPGGRSRVLGDMAVAVSKYSKHRAEAVAAIRDLTSARNEVVRARQAGSVPTRSMLQNRFDIMDNTPFRGPLAKDVLTGIVARPSVITGRSYEAVSRAYYTAVHSALTRQASPREALADLEKQLVRITGLHASRD
jgi:trehalose/maltose transport system substrate-binding protein